MRLPALCFLLILLLIAAFPIQSLGSEEQNCERQFGFAENLFEEKDFFRAITEYKRLIFLFPESDLCEEAYFKIGMSYFGAKRWEESIEAFEVFLERFPESSMSDKAMYYKGICEKELKKYDSALSSFRSILKSEREKYKDEATYQRALVFMDMEDWGRAKETFDEISSGSNLRDSAEIFSTGLENINNVPHKSPSVAGTLAAILPGAGHLYTERPRDALVAFLLNGAFIWGAVELFDDGNNIAGGILTFFEVGWYTGNIYSAVSSAHKFNDRTKRDFIKGLKDRAGLSYYHDSKTSADYLMLNMRF